MQGFPQNHALLLTCRYALGPLQGKMAVIPVRRMYKSVSVGLPAKSEGFASIMVHVLRLPMAPPVYWHRRPTACPMRVAIYAALVLCRCA